MTKYLAFGHEKDVGKDESAKFAIQHARFSNRFKAVAKGAFADKLKQVSYDLFKWAGLQPGYYYDENRKAREIILPLVGMTPREIWIEVGNRMREVYPNIWIDNLLVNDKVDFLVISDLRFPNEAEEIKRRGGKVIKIERPSIPRTSDEADDALLGYTGWSDTIVNDGTLAALNIKVCKIVESMIFAQDGGIL